MSTEVGGYSVTMDEFGVLELRRKSEGEEDQIFRIPPAMVEFVHQRIGELVKGGRQ